MEERTTRNVLSFPVIRSEKDFSIDESDYLAIRDVVMVNGRYDEFTINRQTREMVTIREEDEERRVAELKILYGVDMLPPSITRLQRLVTLDLRGSDITSIPPFIGRLRNLRELICTKSMLNPPNEIGDLVRLKKFDLSDSKITSLPASIGRLQNLEEFNLSNTRNYQTFQNLLGF